MNKQPIALLGLSAGLLTTATPALAHTDTLLQNSLLAGISHPFTGVDHLLAMLAVGIWAAMQKGKQQLAIPATFLILLLAGFMAALNGLQLPMVEGTIASSVLVMGLLIAGMVKLPTHFSLPLISLFALSHGFAHGSELGAATAATFAVGFVGSSLILHLSGSVLVARLTQMPMLVRFGGAAMALTGVGLFGSF